jgi:hypothetical protein
VRRGKPPPPPGGIHRRGEQKGTGWAGLAASPHCLGRAVRASAQCGRCAPSTRQEGWSKARRYLRVRGAARADPRRSGVGLAPRPQALPVPATALVLYNAAEACSPAVFAHVWCIASRLPGVRGSLRVRDARRLLGRKGTLQPDNGQRTARTTDNDAHNNRRRRATRTAKGRGHKVIRAGGAAAGPAQRRDPQICGPSGKPSAWLVARHSAS